MAKLILTKEEKKQSFAQLSIGALGRYCKRAMCAIADAEEKTQKWKLVSLAAAAMLVDYAIQMNADESDYKFDGFTIKGKEVGDWIVTVRKK